MKIRVYHFNLIEIVLTVAVITFGVVLILGMLPKGLNAARNTATLSYASEVMEQIGHYLQLSTINNQTSHVPTSQAVNSVLDNTDITDNYMRLIAQSQPGSNHVPDHVASGIPSNFQSTGMHGVYRYTPSNGVYVIVIGNTEIVDGEPETNVVFSGVIRVWSEATNVRRVTLNGHANGSHASDSECNCDISNGHYSVSNSNWPIRTVHMELSYPLSKEYAARSKSYYSFDVQ